MKQIIDYFIIGICSLAILINFTRVIKVIFQPKWMSHPFFDFPKDRLRRVLLLLCAIAVLLFVIVSKLGFVSYRE